MVLETIVKKDFVKTSYGIKSRGSSHFVVIAPHAAGDDLKTGIIARKLAEQLQAYLVVNKFYFKPTNSKSELRPERVEDFNKLSWSSKHDKYLWKRRKPAMKDFFDDIAGYCDDAKKFSAEDKAVAIYIHGMKDDNFGIDIGIGARAPKNNNKFIGSIKSDYYCSGVLTIKIVQLKKLKALLQRGIEKYNLLVGVGVRYPAWSKRIAIQFHKHCGRSDYAIQLEINNILKDSESNINEVSLLISESLRQTFE